MVPDLKPVDATLVASKHVLETLEVAIEAARRGELQEVVVVGSGRDMKTGKPLYFEWHHFRDILLIMSALDWAKAHVSTDSILGNYLRERGLDPDY